MKVVLLYLQKGAEFILLPGELSRLTPDDTTRFSIHRANTVQLLHQSGEVLDIKRHFDCLSHTDEKCGLGCLPKENLFSSCPTPAIQTHLSEHQAPQCGPQPLSVSVPVGSTFTFNPHAALFSQKAFWALPFPKKNSECLKFNQIWPLLVQKLLWISGNNLMVHIPGLRTQEQAKNADLGEIEKLIMNWHCKRTRLELCVLGLIEFVVKHHEIECKILPQVHAWLQALNSLGYTCPNTTNPSDLCSLYPTLIDPIPPPIRPDSDNSLKDVSNIYLDTCFDFSNKSSLPAVKTANPWVQFNDILLIVVFNTPHYQSIPYVETLYRPFFPQILYCGPGIPDFESPILKNLKFDFYSFDKTKEDHQAGSFNYVCMVGAINMNYSVAGYLFTSDDMIFSISKISTFDKNKTWFFPVWDSAMDDVMDPIVWQWGFKRYRYKIRSVIRRMAKHENDSSVIGQCYNQLKELNRGPFRVNGGLADLYYIPKRLAPQFSVLGSIFFEEEVFLEVAVPTIVQCIESLTNVVELVGEYRRSDRNEPWLKFTKKRFFDRSYMYLHPTKWATLSLDTQSRKTALLRQLYCTKVLPWLHDPLGREPK